MTSSEFLSSVGTQVAESGLAALAPDELVRLHDSAVAAAVSPILLTILNDVGTPEPVRVRALGRVLVALERGAERPRVEYALAAPTAA